MTWTVFEYTNLKKDLISAVKPLYSWCQRI
jgi:hypothetical protein